MKAFNAVQATVFFALAPFGISWVAEQSFKGSTAAFYAACAAYFVGFCFMCAAVYAGIEKLETH